MIALISLALIATVYGDATNTFGYVKTCMNAAVSTCNATHPISQCLTDAGKKMEGCMGGIKGMPADSDLCFPMGGPMAVHHWQPEKISESHSGSGSPPGSHSGSEITSFGSRFASLNPKFGPPAHFAPKKSESASETHFSGSFASGSFKIDANLQEFMKCMTNQFETCSKACTASPPKADPAGMKAFGESMQKCEKESGFETCK